MNTTLLLPPADLAQLVDRFFHASAARRRWSVEADFDWSETEAARLTDGQRSAVRFVTFIEDHLPGYFALYHKYFPVDNSVGVDEFIHNRELYHFAVRWAEEEDTHARVLARYQTESGIADATELSADLAIEGQKDFTLPYEEHPNQYFVYTLVQEKATQIYYQQLRDVVADPVLKSVLNRLSRDEARHFSFMAYLVERALHIHGDTIVEPVREVIANFRMPLADTMRGYWRWALQIADAADYDHTDAYVHLIRVIDRTVDTKSEKLEELTRFIDSCRSVA
jgi:hypothetical protein